MIHDISDSRRLDSGLAEFASSGTAMAKFASRTGMAYLSECGAGEVAASRLRGNSHFGSSSEGVGHGRTVKSSGESGGRSATVCDWGARTLDLQEIGMRH